MTTTVKKLLEGSLRMAGISSVGQSIQSYVLDDALDTLNGMIGMWSIQGIYYMSSEELTLVSSTASYSIGLGATLNTTRPVEGMDSAIRIDDIEYPCNPISRDEYERIPDKTITGRPFCYHYEPTGPNGTLYFFFVPDSAYSFLFAARKELPTYVINDTFGLPAGYNIAIKSNLAMLLAGQRGRDVSSAVVMTAGSSLRAIENSCAAYNMKILSGSDPTGKASVGTKMAGFFG